MPLMDLGPLRIHTFKMSTGDLLSLAGCERPNQGLSQATAEEPQGDPESCMADLFEVISLKHSYYYNSMNPYIINVDRTYPIGEIVGEYGDSQWNKGFVIGHISGVCVGGLLVWVLLSKR